MKTKTKKELSKLTEKQSIAYFYKLAQHLEDVAANKINNVRYNDIIRGKIKDSMEYAAEYFNVCK